VDHGLSNEQLGYVLANCVGLERELCIDTIELPAALGTAPCALYGPLVGDPPVPESDVAYVKRGDRAGKSRVIDAPTRETRLVTVISGPDGDAPCVLYTAFGGPHAPLELFQSASEADRAFWQEHALAVNLSDARIAELEALVAEWQDASGLADACGDGDPDGVLPEHLRQELASLRSEVAGIGRELAERETTEKAWRVAAEAYQAFEQELSVVELPAQHLLDRAEQAIAAARKLHEWEVER